MDEDNSFGRRGGSKRRDSGRFRKRDSGRDFGESDRRDFRRPNRRSERPVMHEVTCDKCGERCEVPFKPTAGKPVYCEECFRKEGNSGSRDRRSGSGDNSNKFEKELEQINRKLDKILEAIESD